MLGLIAATVWIAGTVPRGFIPTLDQGYAILVIQLPDGSSLTRTDDVANGIVPHPAFLSHRDQRTLAVNRARLRWLRVRHVVMYSRPGCGLCDEARVVILAGRARAPFDFDEVDITGNDALELEYGIRIPVVLIDGDELFEIRIDARELDAAIAP